MHINLKKNNEIEWVFSWKELFLLFFKKGKFIITEASLDSFTVALMHIGIIPL